MADDLEIRGGGAIAVDTISLREAARGFDGAARDLADLCDDLVRVRAELSAIAGWRHPMWHVGDGAEAARHAVGDAQDEARWLAAALRESAAIFEIVELDAAGAAAQAGGDAAGIARIDRRKEALLRRYPGAEDAAFQLAARHRLGWDDELTGQLLWASLAGGPAGPMMAFGLALSLKGLVGAVGGGSVPRGARLAGPAPPVVVRALPPTTETSPDAVATRAAAGAPVRALTAPATLAEAASRIPGGGESRVRVERYAMPDRSRRFVVYVAGTQTWSAGAGTDPFDVVSNVELYDGRRSASYEAVDEALRAAGAEPGDRVDALGHSQGAMIASRLALEGEYDTGMLVTFGSPVDADVDDSTLSVAFRHADDPVAGLQGGGHAGTVGAPGSVVVERVADPGVGVQDAQLAAHHMSAYERTAALADGSADPRLDAVRAEWAALATAEEVEVFEFGAERVLPGTVPSEVSRRRAEAGG